MRRSAGRRLAMAAAGILIAAILGIEFASVSGRAEENGSSGSTGSSPARGDDAADDPKLYQLLYDYQFTEPLSTLGQKVRILIWLRYLEFSNAQKQLLLNLTRRFDERRRAVLSEQEAIINTYEFRLEPLYQRIYEAVSAPTPDEATLDALARELRSANLAYKREDELQTMRIQMVRAVLSDERDFLNTLSPEQEERLVTSLFFLRRQIDPFGTPGDYRSVIGPTWNAGDFSSLLKNKAKKDSQLNIGGLWGIDVDSDEKADYANIQRSIVLFFVLKEPVLAQVLEESLPPRKTGE